LFEHPKQDCLYPHSKEGADDRADQATDRNGDGQAPEDADCPAEEESGGWSHGLSLQAPVLWRVTLGTFE
jgi:hypothetical protein